MRKIFLIAAVFCSLTTLGKNKDKQPATVIITAGQSNTDGRVMNNSLPNYIQQNKYKHCLWCYGSAGKIQTNGFETFWPRMVHPSRPGRWAYDAITYYWLEQALQKDFYWAELPLIPVVAVQAANIGRPIRNGLRPTIQQLLAENHFYFRLQRVFLHVSTINWINFPRDMKSRLSYGIKEKATDTKAKTTIKI